MALRVTALRKSYHSAAGPVRALRGIDLEVAEGELVAIVGRSGCGKSTLLNMIAGIDVPDAGEIEIGGQSITGLDEDGRTRMRRRTIGLVFQSYNLLAGVSALQNVALPVILAGRPRREAEDRAREVLDLLGLSGQERSDAETLSGGQQQRVAIARALAVGPALLLADEPTGALDSRGGEEVLELLRRVNARGQTVIVVTHAAAVATVAQRVEEMYDGRLVGGPPGSVAGGCAEVVPP